MHELHWRPRMTCTKACRLTLCLLSLLCVTANAVTINNNLTVVLEDLVNAEDRAISVPEVDRLILQCGRTVNQDVLWTWNGGETSQPCFNDSSSLEINCVNETYNGNYTCSYGSTVRSVTLNIRQDLETLFVGQDLRYIGPNVRVPLPLGPRDGRGGEVNIPCVPVGSPPSGTFTATWLFSTDFSQGNSSIMPGSHPADSFATVSMESVAGSNGSVVNGLLRIRNMLPSVAGYYQCVLVDGTGATVANHTALLYYGPVFDRFSFKNASAIEGHVAEMLCETFAFPVPEIEWARCIDQGDLCNVCENPQPINFSLPKYDSWRPRPAGIALYGIQSVLQVTNAVYGPVGSDRGCYRCRVTHEGGTENQLIFLRIRDDLAVLWPIMGIIAEFIVVALFILGGTIYNNWRQSRKPPTRSASGTSENRNLLTSMGSDKNETPANTNDGPRKRPDYPSVSTTSV